MSSYQIGLFIQASITVISITGIFALTGLSGMFSLGQAGYMAIGSYTTFILASKLGLPFYLTAIIGIAFSALVACIAALPTVRLRKDYFSLISIGLGQAITALIIYLSKYTNGSQGFTKIPRVKNIFAIVIVITIIMIFIIHNLKHSRFGRMCIALKNDELAAKSFAIKVYSLKIKIYVLASIIAAIAGILLGLQNRVLLPESFGWTASSELEIFLFFGGTNSLTGSIISAFTLKMLPELLRNIKLFGQSLQEYRTIIYCILIIIVLNFRTTGLFGEYELSLKPITKFFRKSKNKTSSKKNYGREDA
jgi:branched-chain amino acid transport system permease protein